MAEEKHFTIDTKMEEVDNRNYLYIRTFKQNSAVLLPLGIFVLIGTAVFTVTFQEFSVLGILKYLGVSALIISAVTMLKLEIRHRKRIKNDRSGAIGSLTRMEFYNNYMTMETNIAQGVSKLGYKEFYGLIETHSYYILYYSTSQATMLRKKDISPEIKQSFGDFIREKFEGKYRRL